METHCTDEADRNPTSARSSGRPNEAATTSAMVIAMTPAHIMSSSRGRGVRTTAVGACRGRDAGDLVVVATIEELHEEGAVGR
ncbi:hypothetical protein [Streptosporangium sandarakinum]|uniref:hypothetical protein n=1 Tax=Streptosporangium sandarakinum TaxID=1260955 RepID=UPI00371C2570